MPAVDLAHVGLQMLDVLAPPWTKASALAGSADLYCRGMMDGLPPWWTKESVLAGLVDVGPEMLHELPPLWTKELALAVGLACLGLSL